MAKTVAPLLSFEGSGQIAKTQVYAQWKGRPYVRRYVIPANPRSPDQTLTRNTFKWLNDVFKFYPGSALDAWTQYANVNRFTARNGFLKQNVGPLRDQTDLTNMVLSPSAGSGLIASNISVAEGDGQLTVTLTPPDLPTGWTITGAYALALRNQNPQTEAFYEVTAASDMSSPWEIILAGLTNDEEYIVGGWFSYNRGAGKTAYGQSLQTTATPSA